MMGDSEGNVCLVEEGREVGKVGRESKVAERAMTWRILAFSSKATKPRGAMMLSMATKGNPPLACLSQRGESVLWLGLQILAQAGMRARGKLRRTKRSPNK